MGRLTLPGGAVANVLLVGDRETPRSAALVVPQADGQPKSLLLSDVVGKLDPQQVVDILCMQERCFGKSGLTAPEELS